MPSGLDDYDSLFDAWGQKLNVNPQLGKTVYWMESTGNPNIKNGDRGEQGGMQMLPSTAAQMAVKLGLDPKSVDLRDMRWSVPLAMQYMADGLNATGTAEGMFGYYNSGKADPRAWNQHTSDYVDQAIKSYPNMALKLPQPVDAAAPPASDNTSQAQASP